MIEYLGWEGRVGKRDSIWNVPPTKNTWFKSQTFISCFIFIYCLSNRRICTVSIRCLIHAQLEKECDESFSMIINVLWCIYYFENKLQHNVLSCIFQFYDLICYGYMIVCKMWKIFSCLLGFSTDVPASGMYFASYEFLLNALTPEGKTWVFCLLLTEKFSNQGWTK